MTDARTQAAKVKPLVDALKEIGNLTAIPVNDVNGPWVTLGRIHSMVVTALENAGETALAEQVQIALFGPSGTL